MTGWLKAGLIGGAVLVVVQLIGLVPFDLICCLTFPSTLFIYLGVGALAAAFLPPPRAAGNGTAQGALAAILAAVISSVAGMVINTIRVMIIPEETVTMDLPPALIQQLRDAGIPMELFIGIGGVIVFYSVCCVIWIVVSAILGAIGGAIYPSVKPE
jgi:hypothetical protein